MLLTLVTPPASAVITTAEAKAHLRVEHAAEDTLIASIVATAEAMTAGRDGWTGRALLPQTWRLALPGFPLGPRINLPLPPLRSVASVQYYDAANVLQTLSAANYSVLTADTPGFLELLPTLTWPGTYTRPDAVRVEFSAGYDDAAAVPAPIKHAVLIAAAALYAGRGDAGGVQMPAAIRRLLASYKAWQFNG